MSTSYYQHIDYQDISVSKYKYICDPKDKVILNSVSWEEYKVKNNINRINDYINPHYPIHKLLE